MKTHTGVFLSHCVNTVCKYCQLSSKTTLKFHFLFTYYRAIYETRFEHFSQPENLRASVLSLTEQYHDTCFRRIWARDSHSCFFMRHVKQTCTTLTYSTQLTNDTYSSRVRVWQLMSSTTSFRQNSQLRLLRTSRCS